jgi:hypothetical protein
MTLRSITQRRRQSRIREIETGADLGVSRVWNRYHETAGATSTDVLCSLIMTGAISPFGIFRNSATEAATREYHTVAVTVTGPGAICAGKDQL